MLFSFFNVFMLIYNDSLNDELLVCEILETYTHILIGLQDTVKMSDCYHLIYNQYVFLTND